MVIWQMENEAEKEAISRRVLAALPAWFGIPEATEEYVQTSRNLPFWAAFEKTDISAGDALGFIVLKETSPATAEIYVMGVLPEWHRNGLGSGLFEALRKYAKKQGYSFLQVKTVQKGHYPEYDHTNSFYKGIGFQELECFPTLWGETNPCQILVMSL
ncbi:MAG: GNAT family N-acetyltransferase [Lachnospiraceae bacterium]|jgi:GNAT superfamily N-acetyltransferase|nr:GNAT family N-acetyltransferase [Lachnospiraceae bacterium]